MTSVNEEMQGDVLRHFTEEVRQYDANTTRPINERRYLACHTGPNIKPRVFYSFLKESTY